MFSWNKKKLLMLAMSVSLSVMTFSCGKDGKSPMQPQNVNTQQEEAVIADAGFDVMVTSNNEVAFVATAEEMASFQTEFDELAQTVNSDAKMSVEEIGSGLYTVSYSGDISDIIAAEELDDDNSRRRRRRRRGRKWSFVVKRRDGSTRCYWKKGRIGLRIWYRNTSRKAFEEGSTLMRGLQRRGC